MDRRLVFFLAVALLVVVGGAMLLIGALNGDGSTDPNGVNSAPSTADSSRQ